MVRNDLLRFVCYNLHRFDNLSIDQVNQMLHVPLENKWGFWAAKYGDLTNIPDSKIDSETVVTACLDMPNEYVMGMYISSDCLPRSDTHISIKFETKELGLEFYLKRLCVYERQINYICGVKNLLMEYSLDLVIFYNWKRPKINNGHSALVKFTSRDIVGIAVLLRKTDKINKLVIIDKQDLVVSASKRGNRLGFRIQGKLFQSIEN